MGGTLQITRYERRDFEGDFPLLSDRERTPTLPAGRYTIYGEYDRESQRILINPGKWLERTQRFRKHHYGWQF